MEMFRFSEPHTFCHKTCEKEGATHASLAETNYEIVH